MSSTRVSGAASTPARYTLVVIDDNPIDRQVIARYLERHDSDDYHLFEADRGEEGIALCRERRVDCALIDYHLPDMTGLDVLDRLRRDEHTRDTPVVMLTGAGDERVAVRAIREGAHDYLPKGDLKPAELLRAVKGAITVRRARLDLRESEARFTDLADAMPIYVWLADRHGKPVFVNRAWRTRDGRPSDRTVGGWEHVIHPDDLADLVAHFERAREDGGGFSLELRLFDPPDEVRWVTFNGAPRHGEDDTLLGFVGSATDITERRIAQLASEHLNVLLEERVARRTAELEATNRELEAFSYSISHDLRAPLRAISGFSRVLVEAQRELSPENRHFLERIRTSTHQMGELIDDLLAFSRLGRQELRLHRVDATAVAEIALRKVEASDPDHRAKITLHPLPSCRADGRLLEQVFVNLIANAIKYSGVRPEPTVEIGGTLTRDVDGRAGGEFRYYVKDNGIGFDMAYVDKVFGVFQRLHRSEEFEGTGVGLAIVQRIVHRHGGRVWAEAEVDQGSTFSFSIPADSVPAEE